MGWGGKGTKPLIKLAADCNSKRCPEASRAQMARPNASS